MKTTQFRTKKSSVYENLVCCKLKQNRGYFLDTKTTELKYKDHICFDSHAAALVSWKIILRVYMYNMHVLVPSMSLLYFQIIWITNRIKTNPNDKFYRITN